MQQITEDQFFSAYQPEKNHIDPQASYEGFLYETYGDELAYVRSKPRENVFTLIEGDNGSLCITSGFRVVNRIGYFITKHPFDSDVLIDLGINNDEIEPGIYVFNQDQYSSVQESLEGESGDRINPSIFPKDKQSLIDMLMTFESIINATQNDSWRIVYADSDYQLEAGEIQALSDQEANDLLRRIYSAYGVDYIISDAIKPRIAKHVIDLSINDPDTNNPVEISVYKDSETNGMFAVDVVYLEVLGDADPIFTPFDGREIYLCETSIN